MLLESYQKIAQTTCQIFVLIFRSSCKIWRVSFTKQDILLLCVVIFVNTYVFLLLNVNCKIYEYDGCIHWSFCPVWHVTMEYSRHYIIYLRLPMTIEPSAYLVPPFHQYKLVNCHEYSWNTGTLSYDVKHKSISQSIR